jgi:uncharacterized membrane protein YfcA
MLDAIAAALGGYSIATWLFAALVVFSAGFLRGFTGFGFALAAVPALTLFADPRDVVPATVIIQVLAGFQLSSSFLRAVDWRSLRLLLAGAMLGTPAGIYLLAALPANVLRGFIGTIVIVALVLLSRGFRFKATPRLATRLGIGAISGLLNGGTAMGGPPVIIYFLASPAGVAVGRASLLAYFFFLSLGNAAMIAIAGLLNWRIVILSALMLPMMFLGNALGNRWFDKASARTYERVAFLFLLAVALVAVARGVAGLAS